MKKIIKILVPTMLILLLLTTISFGFKPGDLTGELDVNTEEVEDLANSIIGIIRLLASAISVIMLLVIGIKYMMGSVEEKANYKKTMLPYVIGAVIVFIAPYIAQGIYDISKSIPSPTETSIQPSNETKNSANVWQEL